MISKTVFISLSFNPSYCCRKSFPDRRDLITQFIHCLFTGAGKMMIVPGNPLSGNQWFPSKKSYSNFLLPAKEHHQPDGNVNQKMIFARKGL